MAKLNTNMDFGLIIAVAWIFIAIGVTIFIGPMLGARGWMWLGVHHVLCMIGCTHEIRRHRLRAGIKK